MSRPKFSPDELKPTGKFYPAMPPMMNMEFPPQPVLQRPITPRENIKLAFSGKKPYWIPYAGWFNCDINQFRPRVCPDNIANHQVFDGGEPVDYAPLGTRIHSSWFELDGEFVGAIGGATVVPGRPKVPDITHWEDYVKIPDLDAYDWSRIAEENTAYLGSDKINELGIQCGLWERLMALVDVVEAALALYEEETKPAVHRFFDAYSDFIIDYIRRVADRVPIHMVVLHEDWAHQRGPFFSMDTAREMLMPYLRKIIDYVHSRGMYFETHMCGECSMIVPLMIESGSNIWCGQSDLNDLIGLARKYKDSGFFFGVPYPAVPEGASEEEQRSIAKKFVDEIKDLHVMLFGFGPLPEHFPEYIYEYSRKAFENAG